MRLVARVTHRQILGTYTYSDRRPLIESVEVVGAAELYTTEAHALAPENDSGPRAALP